MQTERLLNKELSNRLQQQDTPHEQPSLFADVFIDSRPTSRLPVAVNSVDAIEQAKSDSSGFLGAEHLAASHLAAAHLAAAQGLAKKLRKGRRQGRTRQRTGIAICKHLIALLHDGDQTERQQPN